MNLSIVSVGPVQLDALLSIFARIEADPASRYFHPHPFTAAEANVRAAYAGRDVYALMLLETNAIGYGILRGWDENYAIPSLGIYIVEEHRGSGAAKTLMEYLRDAALQRGASQVRLKVHPDNLRARRLYECLGYRFSSTMENGEFVGVLDLPGAA